MLPLLWQSSTYMVWWKRINVHSMHCQYLARSRSCIRMYVHAYVHKHMSTICVNIYAHMCTITSNVCKLWQYDMWWYTRINSNQSCCIFFGGSLSLQQFLFCATSHPISCHGSNPLNTGMFVDTSDGKDSLNLRSKVIEPEFNSPIDIFRF